MVHPSHGSNSVTSATIDRVALVPETPLRGALNIDEAARYLGVSRRYVERSDIPRTRLGRRVVYRIVDLDNYLAQRCDLDVAS